MGLWCGKKLMAELVLSKPQGIAFRKPMMGAIYYNPLPPIIQPDAWVFKINANGVLVWQKCLGGSAGDLGFALVTDVVGDIIVAILTFSTDGEVLNNHGESDLLVVKLDALGNKVWSKTYGGSKRDRQNSIINTPDGGYMILGYTLSNDGDVSGNHGNEDIWLVKLNAQGILQWQKTYGGSGGESANDIVPLVNEGYIICGATGSNNGDVSGGYNKGDAWVLKIDINGNILWQKCFGGSSPSEMGYSIANVSLTEFIIAGFTNSNDGDVSGNHGGADGWVLKFKDQ
jgi:hypothetical protein